MTDRVQEEIDMWQKRRDTIKDDLEKLAVELSAAAQVVLIKEIVIIDAHIKDMRDELADMQFNSIVSDYYKGDNSDA